MRKTIAHVKQFQKPKQQLWYIPTESQNQHQVIRFIEQGKDYFRDHFIEESMNLTVREFLELIHVFDEADVFEQKIQRR